METTAQPATKANKKHITPITSHTEGGRGGGMIVNGSSKEVSTEGSSAGVALRSATTARSISAYSRSSSSV
jgi:hypothetical protein